MVQGRPTAKTQTHGSLDLTILWRRAHLLSRESHFSNSFLHQTEMHVIQTDTYTNLPTRQHLLQTKLVLAADASRGETRVRSTPRLASLWPVLHINYGMGIAPRWFRAGIRESHAIWQYMSGTQAQTNSHSRLN